MLKSQTKTLKIDSKYAEENQYSINIEPNKAIINLKLSDLLDWEKRLRSDEFDSPKFEPEVNRQSVVDVMPNFDSHDEKTSHGTSFVSSLYYSFNQHLPVEISPDDIHLMILQGFTRLVTLFPEDFRQFLVNSKNGEKEKLTFVHPNAADFDNMPLLQELWLEKFPEVFAAKLESKIKNKKLAEILQQEYSTSTALDKTIKQASLMGTFSPYFNYIVRTMCNIPQYILLGTEQDWDTIASLPEQITKCLGLESEKISSNEGLKKLTMWLDRLSPILTEMSQARHGNLNVKFWESFYKYESMSGDSQVTGHVINFYPVIINRDDEQVLNSALFTPEKYFSVKQENLPGRFDVPMRLIDDARGGAQYDATMQVGFYGYRLNEQSGVIKPLRELAVRIVPQGSSAGKRHPLARFAHYY